MGKTELNFGDRLREEAQRIRAKIDADKKKHVQIAIEHAVDETVSQCLMAAAYANGRGRRTDSAIWVITNDLEPHAKVIQKAVVERVAEHGLEAKPEGKPADSYIYFRLSW